MPDLMIKSCIIIGLGKIGMEYDYKSINPSLIFTHARAINNHPKFKLIGAVDTSNKKRANFEGYFNLPTFEDPEFAVKKLKPDLVIIATPTEIHSSILARVLRASKIKIILCEKPMGNDVNIAKNMVKMCKDAGTDLFVNYMRRVDTGVLEIKRRIENGQIRPPIKANVWYSKGIINNGSHFLNLLNLWLGDISSTLVLNQGRLFKKFDPEPDFKVDFDKGTAIFRAAWEEYFSHYSIELLSKTGRLVYENGGNQIFWQATSNDPNFNGYKVLDKNKEIIDNSMDVYQWNVYDHIHRYLQGEATTLCTGTQALKTLEGIDLIIKQRFSSG